MQLRYAGAVGVLVAAVCAAAPAQADVLVPIVDGNYSYSEPGKPAAVWEISTVCIQANGTRAQQDYSDITIQSMGCLSRVTSRTDNKVTQDEQLLNTAGDARLTGGLWTFSNIWSSGRICPDGRKVPVTDTFAYDSRALTGMRTTLWGDECGTPPGMTKVPFTLSLREVKDPPMVHRFPDTCNYLVGRPSICS
ncbi:hypothetical protein BVC93_15310 [Mycobacterium sp. MS1601]|uniref:hypothetical protein n=1 Tax=Mycobacterium sp. MS1601 TaxID=1936029 RepID=UPI00097955DA|nr:hypothetical protein [Mycobacterium sp. MS1601]AQA03554.1 hypothetical protein BVC93_15310 [Mycobacterium sp. MS1601]